MATCKDCPYWKRLKEDSFDSNIGICHAIPVHDTKMGAKKQDTEVCFIYYADKYIRGAINAT